MASKTVKKKRAPATQKEREELAARKLARREARHDPDSKWNIALPYVWILLSVFVGFCLYTVDAGSLFGDTVRFLLFGLFSYTAFALPVLLIVLGVNWRRLVANRTLGRRILLCALILLLLLSLIYTLTLPSEQLKEAVPRDEVKLNAGAYFDFADPRPVRGGFIGALIGWIFYRLIGPVGAILAILLAILLYAVFGFGLNPNAVFASLLRRWKESRRSRRQRRAARATAAPVSASVTEAPSPQPTVLAEEPIQADPLPFDEPDLTEPPIETPAATAVEPPVSEPTEQLRPRRFTDLFRPKEEEHGIPTVEQEQKANRIREKLRNREGVKSFPIASLLHKDEPTQPPEPIEDPEKTAAAARDAARARMAEEELLPNTASKPFRDMEDFRRVTVTEPIRVYGTASTAAAMTTAEPPLQTIEPVRTTPPAEPRATNPAPPPKPTSTPTPPAEPIAPVKREAQPYPYPPITLLQIPALDQEENLQEEIQKNADTLVKTLDSFGIPITITGYSRGPRITRYEFVQKAGIRVDKVATYANDITQKLSTQGVRIEAPIPNKSSIGVEVPNRHPTLVRIRSLLDTPTFRDADAKTTVALGCDVTGNPIFFDVAKAPHMLIAGATGMGKSVCINSLLISLLYKASPEEVRLILIDPKQVEFNVYSKIPHLLVPVVTDPTKAAGALNWAVNEMEARYDKIKQVGVRDIKSYNRFCEQNGLEKLPKIVIVIDELSDLMMSSRKMVEESISRIAAKARAAGIHLIIGTQRPSVNVITGDIKANITVRISFRVNQQVDSRTILDTAGAEKLLPQGDMLFSADGTPQRVQGAFVEDDEVKSVTAFLRQAMGDAVFDDKILSDIEKETAKCAQSEGRGEDDEGGNLDGVMDDPKFEDALDVAFSCGSISTSLLQRKLSLGFGRASRIIDAMCEMGVVSEQKGGAKAREVLMSRAEYEERRDRLFDD